MVLSFPPGPRPLRFSKLLKACSWRSITVEGGAGIVKTPEGAVISITAAAEGDGIVGTAKGGVSIASEVDDVAMSAGGDTTATTVD